MSTDRHLNRRITRHEFHVQGLYVGDGWVTVFRTFDSDEADSRLRVLRTKSPMVTYRIEPKRVPIQAVQP
jgi:hypothetical protein